VPGWQGERSGPDAIAPHHRTLSPAEGTASIPPPSGRESVWENSPKPAQFCSDPVCHGGVLELAPSTTAAATTTALAMTVIPARKANAPSTSTFLGGRRWRSEHRSRRRSQLPDCFAMSWTYRACLSASSRTAAGVSRYSPSAVM
jgi:hypothetical protein